jgi:hypothetical protein
VIWVNRDRRSESTINLLFPSCWASHVEVVEMGANAADPSSVQLGFSLTASMQTPSDGRMVNAASSDAEPAIATCKRWPDISSLSTTQRYIQGDTAAKRKVVDI